MVVRHGNACTRVIGLIVNTAGMCVLAALLPETITALCLPDSLTRRHCQVYFPGRVLGRLLSVVAAARLLVAVAPVSLVWLNLHLVHLFLGCTFSWDAGCFALLRLVCFRCGSCFSWVYLLLVHLFLECTFSWDAGCFACSIESPLR